MKPIKLLFVFLLSCNICFGQYFIDGLDDNDPIQDISQYEFQELIDIHTKYLNEAISNKDSLSELYGYGYLFKDYMNHADYTSGKTMIIEADRLASASGNKSWLAWVNHIKGILANRLLNREEALQYYKMGLDLSLEASDSLGMAISYEQIGSTYSLLEQHDTSEVYYELAWPLIRKFGSPHSIGATANNYGSLLSKQGRPSEAIPYYEWVVSIFDSLQLKKEKAKGMNNLADANRRLGRLNKAKEMYENCLEFNRSNNIPENLLSNYSGLYEIALEQDNYKDAHDILDTYIVIRDSLTGVQIMEKIAQLETEYETQEIALELERKNNALLKSQKGIIIRNIGILASLLLTLLFATFLWYRNRSHKLELLSEREKLEIATEYLHEKNKELSTIKKSLKGLNTHLPSDGTKNKLYNIKILTDTDWIQFLGLFERAYPDFLITLKQSNLNLSPAEERLFLLLKLKRSRSEIAVILGVSTDSVKKARSRLRSKIGLDKSESLETFIADFG